MGAPELWFRGEAAGGPVASPGGSIHDFGDGMYLTDQFKVAKMYAETRTSQVDKQVIVAVMIELSGRPRVLDLRTDARWNAYFTQPGGERVLELLQSGRMNEIYGKTFDGFMKANNLSRSQFDVIIGPEYVRGGNQICIVQNGPAPSPLAVELRSRFKAVTIGPPGPPLKAQYRSPEVRSWQSGPVFSLGENFTMPNNPLRRMARNQNAMAAIGIALEGGMMWLQQKGIEREVRRRLETDHRDYVQQALNRGDGVLAIIYMDEWILPDVNGFHPKMMVGLAVLSGSTEGEALERYRSRPNLTPGPSANCRVYEMYQWISGSEN